MATVVLANNQAYNMVSEIRKKKYRHIFDSFLDNNKDGHIDKKDFDLIIRKICQLRKLKPGDPEYIKVEDTWYQILDSLLEDLDANKDGIISHEEWAVLYDRYAKNLTKPPKWQTLYEDFVYEYLNPKNKPGITKDYVENLSFYGFLKDSASAAFDRMSKGTGIITEAEFRQLWTEYFTSDDPNAAGNDICVFVP